MRPGRRVAALVAFCLALAGCTSADSKSDYVDVVRETKARALDAFNQVISSSAEDKQALVEQLEAGEAALGESVSELESLEVPEEARGLHPKLTNGLDDLRALFATTAKDVRASSGTETLTAVTALGSEGDVIGAKIDEATAKIYRNLGAD